jgi:SAM-dependent methyltransferase
MKTGRSWPGEHRRFPASHEACKYTLDRIREEVIAFAKKLPEKSIILDFGCGEKPYYPFFEKKTKEYIGVDIEESPERSQGTDIVIKQGEKLPFSDEHFDAIVSTQVFEHIRDLKFYSEELKRVLKKKGKMLISSAFAWDFHPYPKDYWRITEDGYRHLFKNFSHIEFFYDTNSLQTVLQSVNLLLARKQVERKFLYRFINSIVRRMDHRRGDKKFPANIFVYLEK